jgi:hypothetical protein
LYPELFSFDISKNKNEYPQNHILNIENQLRKERKELFHYKEFWEKFGKQEQNNKIYIFIQILLQNKKKILYNYLSEIFTIIK